MSRREGQGARTERQDRRLQPRPERRAGDSDREPGGRLAFATRAAQPMAAMLAADPTTRAATAASRLRRRIRIRSRDSDRGSDRRARRRHPRPRADGPRLHARTDHQPRRRSAIIPPTTPSPSPAPRPGAADASSADPQRAASNPSANSAATAPRRTLDPLLQQHRLRGQPLHRRGQLENHLNATIPPTVVDRLAPPTAPHTSRLTPPRRRTLPGIKTTEQFPKMLRSAGHPDHVVEPRNAHLSHRSGCRARRRSIGLRSTEPTRRKPQGALARVFVHSQPPATVARSASPARGDPARPFVGHAATAKGSGGKHWSGYAPGSATWLPSSIETAGMRFSGDGGSHRRLVVY